MNGMSSGALILNPDHNAVFLVANGIWLEYIEMEGPCGVLGLPEYTNGSYTESKAGVSQNSKNRGVDAEGARYQRFENGSIYWHWNSKKNKGYTHAVYDKISEIYEKAGGTNSEYGFPVSDVYEKGGTKCQKFEVGIICNTDDQPERCDEITTSKINLGEWESETYIIVIPKNACDKYVYDVNLKKTDELNDKVNDYKDNLKVTPIAAINGDYKDNSGKPEGFNLSRGQYHLSGKHAETRTSLKIDNDNNAFFSVGYNYNVQNALGGGFKIIENSEFKFELTCFSDSAYSNEISCDDETKVFSLLLNGEPVKFEPGRDYDWNDGNKPETGFLARNGQSIIGINSDGDIIMATTPGYYKPVTGGTLKKGGIEMQDLAQYLIEEYDVVEAYRPDGGNEASIYHSNFGKKAINFTIAGYSNEIPTALFVFKEDNAPY